MIVGKVTKAFSDKNRIKIFQFLSAGEKKVSDVASKLNVEENLASHHLRVLASLGFLRNSKKGREVFYRINEQKFINLLKDLSRNDKFREMLEKALED